VLESVIIVENFLFVHESPFTIQMCSALKNGLNCTNCLFSLICTLFQCQTHTL